MESKKKDKWREAKIFLFILGIITMGLIITNALLPEEEKFINFPNIIGEVTEQVSFDPNNTIEIGYEYLNSSGDIVDVSEGETVHIWNTQDDYFFNKSSGIQFTNHYQDYWTKNVFCIGYYSEEEWIKIKCADELNGFTKTIDTDNLTYVNATLWKDISYGAYDLRLAVNYYLGLDDENLTITIYGKNIGIDIPFDLGFAWKITDWDIPSNESDDVLIINNSGYNTKGTYDLMFKNLDETYFKGRDTTYNFGGEFLRVDWNENLNYAIKMYGNGNQEDFYVMLLIDAGHFNPNQKKSTTFQWIDALVTGVNNGFVTEAPTGDPAGSTSTIASSTNDILKATGDTTSSGDITISEFGWYRSDNADGNTPTYSIGIYADSTGVPGSLLFSSTGNTVTNGPGWKVISGLDWSLSGSTKYWIAVWVDQDFGSGTVNTDSASSGGSGDDTVTVPGSMTDPFNGGALEDVDGMYAFYALEQGDVILDIINPTTLNPVSVSSGDNRSILFNLSVGGVNQTSGVTMENVTIGGSVATIVKTEQEDIWYIRTDDDGPANDGTETVTFEGMPDTNYAALAQALTDDDIIYSIKTFNKAQTSFDVWIEEDGGTDEATLFMYGAIEHGHTIDNSKNVECGTETGSANSWAVTFDTNFPDTSYAAICNPTTDTDSPICIQDDGIGKAVSGLTFVLNDDGGGAETVSGIDWCAFEYGEYDIGEVTIKSEGESVTNGAMSVTFTTSFPDTNYIVLITDTDSDPSDGCECEVDDRSEDGFAATCADDAGSTGNCDQVFDWVAIEKGDFNSSIISLQQDFAYTNGSWQVNVTVPTFTEGLKDLYLNATHTGTTVNDTETSAVDYGEANSCSCPAINTNWAIDLTDNCQIWNTCNIGNGNISFTNTGTAEFNATITAKHLSPPPDSNGRLNIGPQCLLNLG